MKCLSAVLCSVGPGPHWKYSRLQKFKPDFRDAQSKTIMDEKIRLFGFKFLGATRMVKIRKEEQYQVLTRMWSRT